MILEHQNNPQNFCEICARAGACEGGLRRHPPSLKSPNAILELSDANFAEVFGVTYFDVPESRVFTSEFLVELMMPYDTHTYIIYGNNYTVTTTVTSTSSTEVLTEQNL